MEIDRLDILVESNTSKANTELDKMISKLQQVQKALSPLSSSVTKAFSGYSSGTKEVVSGNQTMQKSNLSLISSYTKLIGIFYIVKKAFSGLGTSIKSAMDFGETLNMFQTVFRKIGNDAGEALETAFTQRATNFNKKISEMLSLDPKVMMEAQARFAQMANSMGVLPNTAMNISEAFTALGTDISSLFNINIQDAIKKLQSGLAGQIRPLREIGVDISKTSLQMTALGYGIDLSLEKMDAATKVNLRFLSTIQQMRVAMGDMARTLDQPANQLRILQQQWSLFTRTLGSIFIPMVQKILPYLNGFVIALRRVAQAIANFFGYKLPDFTETPLYGVGEYMEEEFDNASSAIGGTTKAVDKLKKTMSTFGRDELNIIQQETPDTGGGGGGGAGGGLPAETAFPQLDKAIADEWAKYQAMLDNISKGLSNQANTIADTIINGLKGIIDFIKPFTGALKAIGAGLLAGFAFGKIVQFFNWLKGVAVIGPILGAVGLAFTTFFKALGAGFNILDGIKLSWYDFQKSMKSMSGVQKTQLAIAGFIAILMTAYDAFKKLAIGSEDAGTALAILVPVVAAFGVAMYAAMGPLGIVIAGLALLVGGIAGYVQGTKELQKQKVDKYFGGVAVSADDVNDSLSGMVSEYTDVNDKIDEYKSKIKSLGNEYDLTESSANQMFTKFIQANELATDSSDTLYTSLTSMADTLKKVADEDTNYYYNSWKRMYDNTSVLTAEQESKRLSDILQFGEDKKKWIDNIEQGITDIHTTAGKRNAGNAVTYTQEELAKLKGFNEQLDALMAIERGKTQERQKIESAQFVSDIMSGRKKVTAENYEELLKTIKEKETEGTNAVNDAHTQQILDARTIAAEQRLVYAGNADKIKEINANLVKDEDVINNNRIKGLNNISTQTGTTTSIILWNLRQQREQLENVRDMANEANATMAERAKYKVGTEEFERESAKLSELNAELSKHKEIVELVGGQWVSSVDTQVQAFSTASVAVDTTLDEMVKNFADYGYDSEEEFRKAIETQRDSMMSTGTEMFGAVSDGIEKGEQDYTNQPIENKVGYKLGSDTIQNVVEGAENISKSQAVLKIFADIGKSLSLSFSEAFEMNSKTNVRKSLQNLADGMGLKVEKDGKIKVEDNSPFAVKKVPGFATGGFPEYGQLFMAREKGPEMVGTMGGQTAVANNQQIVQGIASGVYQATSGQMALLSEQNALLRALLAKDQSVYLDGDKIYDNQQNVKQSRGFAGLQNPAYAR